MYIYIYENSARFARRFLVSAEDYMLASLRSASGYPLPIYICIYMYVCTIISECVPLGLFLLYT